MPRPFNWTEGAVVPPVGGRVLNRALYGALNRVPGRYGRYTVDLAAMEFAVLSERTRGPIAVFGPFCGALVAPYTFAGQGDGWPFKRHAAIIHTLTGGTGTVALNFDGLRASLDIHQPGRPPNRRAVGNALALIPDVRRGRIAYPLSMVIVSGDVTATYYLGNRGLAQVSGRIIDALEDLLGALYDYSQSPNLTAWAAVVGPRESGQSLAAIPPAPTVYNSETDPGGSGDPTGAENGDASDYEPWDNDSDDDTDRPTPPRPVTPGPASSFRDWERAAIPAPARPALALYDSEECAHCRGILDGSRPCPPCQRDGQCGGCGRTLPGQARGPGPVLSSGLLTALYAELDNGSEV